MDYRLIEDHPLIGRRGQVFSKDEYKAVKHFDRPLFEPVTPEYSYPFMLDNNINNKSTSYLLDTIFDVEDFICKQKHLDDWVKFGIIGAAKEKRNYKFMGNLFSIVLTINE